jgi:hypothetical protein
MKFNKLASYIARRESKKKQVTIGNIRETLAIVAELLYSEKDFPDDIKTYKELMRVGQRRLARKRGKA